MSLLDKLKLSDFEIDTTQIALHSLFDSFNAVSINSNATEATFVTLPDQARKYFSDIGFSIIDGKYDVKIKFGNS